MLSRTLLIAYFPEQVECSYYFEQLSLAKSLLQYRAVPFSEFVYQMLRLANLFELDHPVWSLAAAVEWLRLVVVTLLADQQDP